MGVLDKSIINSSLAGMNVSNSSQYIDFNLQIITGHSLIGGKMIMEALMVTRDYVNGFMDEIFVAFKMERRAFYEEVWYNRHNLFVDLTFFNGLSNTPISTTRYMMFITTPTDTETDIRTNTNPNTEYNKEEFVDVQAQLVYQFDLILNSFRSIDNYSTATVGDVILAEFENALANVKLSSGDPKYTINMIPPDNETLYNNILLSPGKEGKLLKLLHVPKYLQNNTGYGVYNSDIGVYIQHGYITSNQTSKEERADIFIYPIYRPNVDPSSEKYPFCTILSSISTMPNIGSHEKGYTVDAKSNVYIYPIGHVKVTDDGGTSSTDHPSGFLHIDPTTILAKTGQIETKGDKLIVKNGLEAKYNIRESYNDIANDVSVGMTANKCLLAAKGLLPSLSIYEATVNNVTFDRVYPGMPTILQYEVGRGDNVKTVYGTIISTKYTLLPQKHALTGKIVVAAGKASYYNKTKKEKEQEKQ